MGTIGKRGPSSFIFEPVYYNEFDPSDIKNLRAKLQITQQDMALVFDINQRTLQRIEKGISQDPNTLKHLQIILNFPDVAIWQLKQTGSRVHKNVLAKLLKYFETQSTKN